MHRPLTVIALMLGLIAAGAGSASAATRKFDVWTAADYTPGRAHTYGVVDFQFGNEVTVRGRLNDVCPGDGHGAYLRVTFVLDNGTTRVLSTKDVTGCRNEDGVDFALTQTVSADHMIKAVKLHLYEYDADRNSLADTADKRIPRP